MPFGDLTNLATGGGLIFWIGILLLVFAGAAFYFGRGRGARMAGGMAVFGIVVVVIGIAVAGLTPAATTVVAPTVPGTTVNTLLASSPALPTGETWNSASNTLTVNLLYNVTTNYFCTASTFAATKGCVGITTHNDNFVYFPMDLIRTDAVNTTASFATTLSSIPTAVQLGGSGLVYSIVGFKAATSSVPGQWQTYFSAGTTAAQYPSVNAPSVSTAVQTDGVAVGGFGSKINVLHVSLAGGNSTSAPESFAAALTNYTAYPSVINIAQSTPASLTIDYILIGWTT